MSRELATPCRDPEPSPRFFMVAACAVVSPYSHGGLVGGPAKSHSVAAPSRTTVHQPNAVVHVLNCGITFTGDSFQSLAIGYGQVPPAVANRALRLQRFCGCG